MIVPLYVRLPDKSDDDDLVPGGPLDTSEAPAVVDSLKFYKSIVTVDGEVVARTAGYEVIRRDGSTFLAFVVNTEVP